MTSSVGLLGLVQSMVTPAVMISACGLLYLAVAVFALTSLCVGLSRAAHVFEVLMLVLFVLGLATVVWAGILAYLEVRLSHHAITEEIKELRLHG